ncbi:hypothetical protein [Rhodopirellula sp. P2]|uniref:hypothetical protein n=1 Tax=Rhodopirellula sp. P2 TaxID=2127060 RepID=UPI0023676BAA|nr:hypothetical protein [Rhodopirellula sp. P2]WDQ17466.1 hypothetical protein PSR62_02675 [Rhodopirellula sp. P2]
MSRAAAENSPNPFGRLLTAALIPANDLTVWTPALDAPPDRTAPTARQTPSSPESPPSPPIQPASESPRRYEPDEPGQMLKSLQWELNRIQRTVRHTLQSKLQGLVGQSLSSLNENRELASSIQKMLDTHSLRIRCPQCGHASILRVSPRKGMPGGAFVLDHTIDGKRTFHGGSSSVPPIQLTAKPERKATAAAKTRAQPATAGTPETKVG